MTALGHDANAAGILFSFYEVMVFAATVVRASSCGEGIKDTLLAYAAYPLPMRD